MRHASWFSRRTALVRSVALVLVATPTMLGGVAAAQTPTQATFPSPQEAMTALVAAAKSYDRGEIARILGPKSAQLVSGDAVRDARELDAFAKLAAEKIAVEPDGDKRSRFVLGEIEWPFPITVVAEGGAWRFDTDAGIDEVIARRIGANELAAIAACRAYALAQWEYFTTEDWDSDGVAEYAQLIRSAPGKRDGLYWKTVGDATPSPLGRIVAAGEVVGYKVKQDAGAESDPFLGYRFKILTRQGPHAAGGPYSYVINGNMIAGFALVAYPVTYGNSGVMTFIISHQGRVYQKDLGANTATIAAAITTFDPDATWKLVDGD